MVGAELREAVAFCWVETIAPWSSWQSFSTLPMQTAAPCPVCLPWSIALPRDIFYPGVGGGSAAVVPDPGPVSAAAVVGAAGSWRLSQLPQFRKLERLTSAWDLGI